MRDCACTLSSPQASATSLEGLSVRWGRPRVWRRLTDLADRALVGVYWREFALAGICSGIFSVRQERQPCQLTASDGASVSNGPNRAVLQPSAGSEGQGEHRGPRAWAAWADLWLKRPSCGCTLTNAGKRTRGPRSSGQPSSVPAGQRKEQRRPVPGAPEGWHSQDLLDGRSGQLQSPGPTAQGDQEEGVWRLEEPTVTRPRGRAESSAGLC